LQGWAMQLQDFCFTVQYRPGRENIEADSLSRQEWTSDTCNPGGFHLTKG